MKIRLRRKFSIQVAPTEVKTYERGEHSIPGEMPKAHAERAVKFGAGYFVQEKVAPENKLANVPENKAKVARKPVRRSSSRSKPDA